MTYLALVGAISFCTFMAMSFNNIMIQKIPNHREFMLVPFLALFGVVSRIFFLNPFISIIIIGILASAFFAIIFKGFKKGVALCIYLTALLFGLEGINILISPLVGYQHNYVFLIHIYIATVLVVISLSFLLKKLLDKYDGMKILNNHTMGFLLISASLVLVFTLKNFALPNVSIHFGPWAIDFRDIAYLLSFISGLVMFIIILRYISKETTLKTEKMLIEASKEYVRDLEDSYKALRTIKHDYVNILSSFKLYIDNDDMAGLKKYYNDELFEMNKDLLRGDQLMGSLHNLLLSEIKSVLVYKCSMASSQDIKVSIEAKEPIKSLGVSTAIVCQMLGILLDNAIEASLETDEKELHLAILKNPSSTVFIIKNSWKRQDIPINRFFESGFSTKEQGRGIGLHTARRYTEKFKGLYLETEIRNNYFTQILTAEDE